MAITTTAQEVKRLRSYLNPYIKGPSVDAVLLALAQGSSSYLVNNVEAVNDNMYITTAVGDYLDQRLADYGIVRPPSVGLSDDIFSEIGIAVKNRKQVRDLINSLLNSIFGDEFVRASNPARQVQPYQLADGDTLIINFDGANTTTVTFSASQFEDVAAATAQEVADSITKYLRNLGLSGTAIAKDNGNGPFVEILSDTVGPASSVTIVGGSSQNQLRFDAPVGAGGNSSTQWTLSLQPGGVLRYTWTGGANPQIGKVSVGNYVNIFGGGFASSANVGSYTISAAVGGVAGVSYFEVSNPLGTPGVIVQGTETAVLFYNPIKKTLLSQQAYAAVYQTQSQILQIFLPAATQVIRRSRLGSAHLHDAPGGVFTFGANAVAGDTFAITSTISYTAGADFQVGADTQTTIANLAAAINAGIPGLVAYANTGYLTICSDSAAITLVVSYGGSQKISGSGPQGDNVSLVPNQQGPYIYDTAQPFTVSSIGTVSSSEIDGTQTRVLTVKDSSQFPDAQGYLILGYGTEEQEGPIPYIGTPSSTTILISPAYTIQNIHPAGTDVALITKSPVVLATDGTDYPFYITGVADGRVYAQELINSIAATGITIVYTILYPGDIGLGKWGTIYSENPIIWGA